MTTTPIIRLRAMEPEDLDALYSMENNESLWPIGITNVPYSRYVLRDFICQSTGDIYTDKQVRLMVENEAGETVGMADLTTFDPKHLRAEIGLVIMDNQRHKGYARAAMEALHHYAKATLHLHQVYAVIASDNTHCLHLFHTLGYSQTGTLTDWLFDGTNYHDAILLQHVL